MRNRNNRGVPFMLFLTKTKKVGMVAIMGTLPGIILGLMGMGCGCNKNPVNLSIPY